MWKYLSQEESLQWTLLLHYRGDGIKQKEYWALHDQTGFIWSWQKKHSEADFSLLTMILSIKLILCILVENLHKCEQEATFHPHKLATTFLSCLITFLWTEFILLC